jgi:hypothetical protein
MIRGILKRCSLPGMNRSEDSDASSLDSSPKPKRVSFDGEEPARVFQADEWDRSPAEVTLKLTYKSVLPAEVHLPDPPRNIHDLW